MKKVAMFYLLGIICIFLLFLSGCDVEYIESEGNVWLYRVLTEKNRPNNPESVGTAVIISLLDPEAITDENGHVTVPSEIDGYRVTELGDIGDGVFRNSIDNQMFYFGINAIERLIIPSGIKINRNFFMKLSANYVEFMSDEPYIFIYDDDNYHTTWIVPNGIKETFLTSNNIVFSTSIELERVKVIEKWEIDGY